MFWFRLTNMGDRRLPKHIFHTFSGGGLFDQQIRVICNRIGLKANPAGDTLGHWKRLVEEKLHAYEIKYNMANAEEESEPDLSFLAASISSMMEECERDPDMPLVLKPSW